MTSTIDYLGFRFLDAGLAGVRDALSKDLGRGAYGFVVTPNVDHVVSYHRGGNPMLAAAYDQARFQICDSRVLTLLARMANRRLTPVPGSDLTESLLADPVVNGKRIAVIGPSPEDFEILRRRFPRPLLSFIPSGQRLAVGSPEWDETVERASHAEWDILLVCLSFPKQEFFALDLAKRDRRGGLALCVGAGVDFLTGRQKRAPLGIRRAGLEWLHRLASNPGRMAGRYLVRGPQIFSIVARDLWKPAKPPAARREGGGAKRVLYLSTVLPHGLRGGGEICSMNFIDAMKQAGCDVDVVAYQRAGQEGPLPADFHSPRQLVIESGLSPAHSTFWMLRSVLFGRAFSVDKYVTRAMRSFVQARLGAERWDLVAVDHAQAGWLLPLVPEGVPVVLVAHNVEHRLYETYADRTSGAEHEGMREQLKRLVYRREARKLLDAEREAAKRAVEIWSLSESDRAAIRAIKPVGRVRAFGVPGQSFPKAERLPDPAIDIGLLGNWAWDVNRAGLDWFLEQVVPLLSPDVEVVAAGNSDHAPGTRHGNVRFAGFVPDAADFLRQCRVVAVPSTVGSGVQIKTIETLGLGVPTVATPVAMRGIDQAPSFVRVALQAEEMASAIGEALNAPRPDGAEGRLWWEGRRDRFQADIAAALDDIFSARKPAEAIARPSPKTAKSTPHTVVAAERTA